VQHDVLLSLAHWCKGGLSEYLSKSHPNLLNRKSAYALQQAGIRKPDSELVHLAAIDLQASDPGIHAFANENNEAYLKEGEVVYGKFCVHCHGAAGEGDGKVGLKLPGPPPAYSTLTALPEGKMFHSITYGKGLMGSHASQLTQEERWKVVLYVQKLQFPNGKTVVSDSTASAKK
jgi:mono/diheme cytochrome c family protein